MFARLLAIVIFAASSAAAFSCSCSDIASIETTISNADAVIVGRIRAHIEPNYGACGERCAAQIEIEALESLKGAIGGRIRIDKAVMCYQSIPDDLLRVGDSYVPTTQSELLCQPKRRFGANASVSRFPRS